MCAAHTWMNEWQVRDDLVQIHLNNICEVYLTSTLYPNVQQKDIKMDTHTFEEGGLVLSLLSHTNMKPVRDAFNEAGFG